VRVSISNYENVLSNAVRRAIRLGERQVSPRISDLPAMVASTAGKIELETVGEASEERIIDRLIQGAVLNVFNRYFLLQEFDELLANFERGFGVDTGDHMPVMQYVQQVSEVRGLRAAVGKLNAQGNPASAAAAVEFILEGMHLNRKLNKDRKAGVVRYRK
jgi:magnesium chelatase subunit I